jgi:hypothetical protein
VDEKDERAGSAPNRLTKGIGYSGDRWDTFDPRALPFRHQARGDDGRLSPNIASVKPELKSLGFNHVDIRVFVMRLEGKTRDDVVATGTTPGERAALKTAYNKLTASARLIQREVHGPKGAPPPPKTTYDHGIQEDLDATAPTSPRSVAALSNSRTPKAYSAR